MELDPSFSNEREKLYALIVENEENKRQINNYFDILLEKFYQRYPKLKFVENLEMTQDEYYIWINHIQLKRSNT